jgi:FkbM family methyltransferase
MSILRRSLRQLKRAWGRAQKRVFGDFQDYLSHCQGVIHVGANTGQERETYVQRGLRVVWIEPIPDVYQTLVKNIADYENQVAINALITDKDGADCLLHVANNGGASSSILDLHLHRDIWPDVGYVRDLAIKSETLPSTLQRAGVKVEDYDALLLGNL